MQWISIKDQLPEVHAGVFIVKTTKDDQQIKSLFYQDGVAWRCWYGFPSCHWWEYTYPNKPIYNVTHWKQEKN